MNREEFDSFNAVNELLRHGITLKTVIQHYYNLCDDSPLRENDWALEDIASYKSGAQIRVEFDGKKTIDQQTHADIVGLIEAEMAEVACGNYNNSGDRLASVIEGRLGYEKPASCLPDITQGDWEAAQNGPDGLWHIFSNQNSIGIFNDVMHTDGRASKDATDEANAKLSAAAPKLAEACAKLISYCYRDSGHFRWPLGTDAIEAAGILDIREALREAGADI
jgi:hypothetical protein